MKYINKHKIRSRIFFFNTKLFKLSILDVIKNKNNKINNAIMFLKVS